MTKQSQPPITKLDKDNYIVNATGEVKEFAHTKNRADNVHSISQSMSRLRDIINANVTDANKCLWLTLTYAERMTDNERLYKDFKKFNMRFRYYLEKNHMPTYEYISCAEPQSRGAWHLHLILIFKEKAPFIPNNTIADIWRHGFTKTKRLTNTDNVGLYLTAYLTDIELSATTLQHTKMNETTIKKIETVDENGTKHTKHYIKGGRLHMYPQGMRLYRTNAGIKRPIVTTCTENEAMTILDDATLTYEKTIQIDDECKNVINVINYRQYNIDPAKMDEFYSSINEGEIL